MGVIDWILIPSDVVGEYCHAIGLIETRHWTPFGLVRVGAWKVFTQLKFIFERPTGFLITQANHFFKKVLSCGDFYWPLKRTTKNPKVVDKV